MLKQLVWLSLAGMAGTLARYALQGLVQRLTSAGFPWGTVVVNLLGCFAFGIVWSLADERLVISGQTRTILLVGFMGAFTTFSTFAFETAELLRDSEWLRASSYWLGQSVFGVMLIFAGVAVGRLF